MRSCSTSRSRTPRRSGSMSRRNRHPRRDRCHVRARGLIRQSRLPLVSGRRVVRQDDAGAPVSRSSPVPAIPAPSAGLNPVSARPSRDRLHPEYLVKLLRGKRVVARGNGAENLGVELDLVERHAVMDTKIETLTHRVHLLAKGSTANPGTRLRRGPVPPHDPTGPFPDHLRGVLLVLSITIPISRPYRVREPGKGGSSPARRPAGPRPVRHPVAGRAPHVAGGGVRQRRTVGVGELAHHPARHTGHEDAGREPPAGADNRACRYQRPGADACPAEHDRPDPDERAGLDVRAVHSRPVPQRDPLSQDHRLPGVHMQAALVLDIAFFADHDLVVVGPQHRAVPDAGGPAHRHPAHQHHAGGDPRLGMDRRCHPVQRPEMVAAHRTPPARRCASHRQRPCCHPPTRVNHPGVLVVPDGPGARRAAARGLRRPPRCGRGQPGCGAAG